jgi:hypothetical protein
MAQTGFTCQQSFMDWQDVVTLTFGWVLEYVEASSLPSEAAILPSCSLREQDAG